MSVQHWKWLVWPVIACVLWMSLAGPAAAYMLPFSGYPKLEVSGSNTLSLNLFSVDGSQSYYQDDNYGYDRPFTSSSDLLINGELLKNFQLYARINANPYMPNRVTWNLKYNGNGAKVLLGDFNANMGNNEFASLLRSLTGVQVDVDLPRNGHLSTIYSELKSPVRTDTFYGRNVTGPYYLSTTPIVDGSEVVTIDDTRQERTRDYTLDYTNGILNFTTAVIRPDQRIVISYEVASNGASGTLYAVRGTYPIKDNATIGITQLMVRGKSTGPSEEEKRDQFLGNNTPGPFYLTFRPIIVGSEQVTVNGLPRVREIDYTIDYTTGALLFINNPTNPSPPHGSTVTVYYRVSVAGSSSGDRTITGTDLTWQFGNSLGLTLQAAKSNGASTRTLPPEQISNEPIVVQNDVPLTEQVFHLRKYPVQVGSDSVRAVALTLALVRGVDYSIDYETGEIRLLKNTIPIAPAGPSLYVTYATTARVIDLRGNTALGVTARYDRGKITGTASYRSVDPGFSPLEAVGYQNSQEALTWMFNYSPSELLTFNTSGDNTHQPYNPYAYGNYDQALMANQNRNYSVDFHKPNWPQITLRRTTRNSRQIGGNDQLGNASDSNSLLIHWVWKAFTASFNLSRTNTDSRQLRYTIDPYAPITDTTDVNSQIAVYQAVTDNASLNLLYQPNDRFNVDMNLFTNTIHSTSDDHTSDSRGKNLTTNASYRLTETLTLTGNLTTSSTDATTTASGTPVPELTTKNLTLGADWRAASTLNVNLNYSSDKYEGGQYSNSTSRNLSANASWQPYERLTLNGYWFRQTLAYLDQSGDSTNNMVGMNAEFGPILKATVSLDAQHIWGENSFGVNQLYQTEGLNRRGAATRVEDDTVTQATGNRLTTLTAKITYPLGKRHDVFLLGELLQNSGLPSASRKRSVGLGWDYHVANGLTLTLNANRTLYVDEVNPELDYNANRLNAELSWNF